MLSSDAELSALIRPLVKNAFEGFDLDQIEVRSDEDHDGDPVVRVEVRLKTSERRYPPDVTFRLASDIVGALNEAGDSRFPLIGVYYASDEPNEDFYPEVKAKRASRR